MNETQALVKSMLTGIMNKITMCLVFAKKNKELAFHPDFKNLISALGEQIIPQWCRKNMSDPGKINELHNLLYLFSQKTHQVFQARVIHQIIDQNWDLKGFRAVLWRILDKLNIQNTEASQNLDKYIEKIISF